MPTDKLPPRVLPKFIVAAICVCLIVIANIPPRSPGTTAEPQIHQKAGIPYAPRYLFENLAAFAIPSQSLSARYVRWYSFLFVVFAPWFIPFLVQLLREWRRTGIRRYARWTLLDRVAATGIVVGCGLRLWAILSLGTYFTYNVTLKENQPLLRTGPYRVFRLPLY